ncbi:MAG: hypothetical protein ABJD97_24375 [Betaproteobacteria bacterium]
MPSTGRFDHLRHSALELLASGNGTVAVARVLDVPASVVARWRDEPAPVTPAAAVAVAAAHALGQPIVFRTTLVHAPSLPFRLWNLALALYVAASVAVGLAGYLQDSGSTWRHHAIASFTGAVLIGCVLWCWGKSLTSLVLGPDGIVVPRWFGRTVMAYSDLADYWLVLHVLDEGTDEECVGRLLSLHSRRPGVAPIEVFVRDNDPLDPRLIDRLDRVRKANQGVRPLTPLRSIVQA